MRCLYIPYASFKDELEIECINKKLQKLRDILFEEVSDDVEVWIVGNKDQKFFKSIMQEASSNNRVLDPSDELPINRYRKLTHVAVINYKYSNTNNVTRETIYGNTDYHIYDFISVLLHRLKLRFPKLKSQIVLEHKHNEKKPDIAA